MTSWWRIAVVQKSRQGIVNCFCRLVGFRIRRQPVDASLRESARVTPAFSSCGWLSLLLVLYVMFQFVACRRVRRSLWNRWLRRLKGRRRGLGPPFCVQPRSIDRGIVRNRMEMDGCLSRAGPSLFSFIELLLWEGLMNDCLSKFEIEEIRKLRGFEEANFFRRVSTTPQHVTICITVCMISM